MSRNLLASVFGAFVLLWAGAAEAQSCRRGPFEGFYFGPNIGFGRSDADQTSPNEPKIGGTDSAFVAGGQIGYNWHCGRMVYGIEADLNYSGFEVNTAFPDPIFLTDKIDWFGTVRGRLGITLHDATMLYVTGGLAFAQVEHTLNSPAPVVFRQTDKDIEFGWTIGAGIEKLCEGRWLLRAEALFVDLGDQTRNYHAVAGCLNCNGRANWDDSFWVGRLAISYKFGQPEPYRPLK
jgi:outer membrane immunogenic protein